MELMCGVLFGCGGEVGRVWRARCRPVASLAALAGLAGGVFACFSFICNRLIESPTPVI